MIRRKRLLALLICTVSVIACSGVANENTSEPVTTPAPMIRYQMFDTYRRVAGGVAAMDEFIENRFAFQGHRDNTPYDRRYKSMCPDCWSTINDERAHHWIIDNARIFGPYDHECTNANGVTKQCIVIFAELTRDDLSEIRWEVWHPEVRSYEKLPRLASGATGPEIINVYTTWVLR